MLRVASTSGGPGCGSIPWVTRTSLGTLQPHLKTMIQNNGLVSSLLLRVSFQKDVEKVFRRCLAQAPLVQERATAVRERNVGKAAVSVPAWTSKHGLSIRAVVRGCLEAAASRPSGQPGRETVEIYTDLGAAIRMEFLHCIRSRLSPKGERAVLTIAPRRWTRDFSSCCGVLSITDCPKKCP